MGVTYSSGKGRGEQELFYFGFDMEGFGAGRTVRL